MTNCYECGESLEDKFVLTTDYYKRKVCVCWRCYYGDTLLETIKKELLIFKKKNISGTPRSKQNVHNRQKLPAKTHSKPKRK